MVEPKAEGAKKEMGYLHTRLPMAKKEQFEQVVNAVDPSFRISISEALEALISAFLLANQVDAHIMVQYIVLKKRLGELE